jgi:hypothetical protein
MLMPARPVRTSVTERACCCSICSLVITVTEASVSSVVCGVRVAVTVMGLSSSQNAFEFINANELKNIKYKKFNRGKTYSRPMTINRSCSSSRARANLALIEHDKNYLPSKTGQMICL